MSASREKKKRQELLASGVVDVKAVREAEQKAAAKKENILYTGLAVAFVVIAIALFVINSGLLQRSESAVVIDGKEYTAADMNYYYGNAYQNFLNQFGGMASSIGLDTNKDLKDQTASQMITGSSEAMTWHDYFEDMALDSLKNTHALAAKAEAEGLSLDEADMKGFDLSIETMKTNAASYGYSYKSYLATLLGPGVTPEVYETNLKQSLLAQKYIDTYLENLSFSDDEVQAYYEANKNTYDLVDGAYIIVNGAPETKTEEDGDEIAPTHEEIKESMEAAEKVAKEIMNAYKNGEDLKSLSEKYEGTTYYGSENMAFTSGISGDWFFSDFRKNGDTEILEDMTDYRYYVAVFNSRSRDNAVSYDVRHILLDETSVTAEEGAEVTSDMIAARAQEILDSWDGTEEGFAALAEEFSTDPGSNTNGGLYENVKKGEMIANFNDWCYEDGRQTGDTGIVATSYGQHIMYFVGYGDTEFWYAKCEDALKAEAYNTWNAELVESVVAETKSGMDKVGF